MVKFQEGDRVRIEKPGIYDQMEGTVVAVEANAVSVRLDANSAIFPVVFKRSNLTNLTEEDE